MNIHTALIVAGCIFAFVAFMHFLRLIYKADVHIGTVKIPMWASALGFVIPVLLSLWMFMAAYSH